MSESEENIGVKMFEVGIFHENDYTADDKETTVGRSTYRQN
jgi:hypothetical protein